MKNELFNFVLKYKGNWDEVYNALKNKEKVTESKCSQINYVALCEDNYFDKFKEMYLPPFCIFYKGNINLLNEKIISVFYKVNNENFADFLKFKAKGYCVCISKNNIPKEFINTCQNLQIKLILVCNKSLRNISLIEDDNIVYISEYYTKEISSTQKQTIERIIYSLADKVYIRDNYNNNLTRLYNENYNNEQKPSYYSKIKNSKDCKYLSNRVFKKIDNISEIFN